MICFLLLHTKPHFQVGLAAVVWSMYLKSKFYISKLTILHDIDIPMKIRYRYTDPSLLYYITDNQTHTLTIRHFYTVILRVPTRPTQHNAGERTQRHIIVDHFKTIASSQSTVIFASISLLRAAVKLLLHIQVGQYN